MPRTHKFTPTHEIHAEGIVVQVQLIDGELYTDNDMGMDVPEPSYALVDGVLHLAYISPSEGGPIPDARLKAIGWDDIPPPSYLGSRA